MMNHRRRAVYESEMRAKLDPGYKEYAKRQDAREAAQVEQCLKQIKFVTPSQATELAAMFAEESHEV